MNRPALPPNNGCLLHKLKHSKVHLKSKRAQFAEKIVHTHEQTQFIRTIAHKCHNPNQCLLFFVPLLACDDSLSLRLFAEFESDSLM